jgi:predicted nucleic acid-binding protein
MASEILVDTSGFYALLVRKDDRHREASRILRDAARQRQRFVTTDYVLDETTTLLKARGHGHLLERFFETVVGSPACRIEWTDAARFAAVQTYFLKHLDQAWSFTDCVSFRVMKELRLRESLTKDMHYEEAGFTPLLK